MKTILFTLCMTIIAFASFGATSSYAHCGGCGTGKTCEKTLGEKAKPCTKCVKSGKTCNCASKKSHDHADKPCVKCAQSEKAWNKKNKSYKTTKDHSKKGSLTIKSRGAVDTGYNE